MKTKLFLLLLIVLSGCVSRDIVAEIDQFLESGDHFKAQESFRKYQYRFNQTDYLYFAGMLANAFNNYEQSIQNFQTLLAECENELSDSTKVKIFICQMDNYLKTGNRQKAAEINELLLDKYGKEIPEK